jgi:hypothetical protein
MIITGEEVHKYICKYQYSYYGHYLRAMRQIGMVRKIIEGNSINDVAFYYNVTNHTISEQLDILFHKLMFCLGYGKTFEEYLSELSKLTDEDILKMVISNSHQRELGRLGKQLETITWEEK